MDESNRNQVVWRNFPELIQRHPDLELLRGYALGSPPFRLPEDAFIKAYNTLPVGGKVRIHFPKFYPNIRLSEAEFMNVTPSTLVRFDLGGHSAFVLKVRMSVGCVSGAVDGVSSSDGCCVLTHPKEGRVSVEGQSFDEALILHILADKPISLFSLIARI